MLVREVDTDRGISRAEHHARRGTGCAARNRAWPPVRGVPWLGEGNFQSDLMNSSRTWSSPGEEVEECALGRRGTTHAKAGVGGRAAGGRVRVAEELKDLHVTGMSHCPGFQAREKIGSV